jgi:phosphoglycolate phosphatase
MAPRSANRATARAVAHVAGACRGALIFDLDGTLVDSAADLHASLNRALAAEGLRAPDLEAMTAMIGDGVQTLLVRALAAVDVAPEAALVERLLPRFMQAYRAQCAQLTRPYPGVLETLGALRAAGWRLGVCTNKPIELSLAVLQACGLKSHFGTVIGGDSTPARKPDPLPLRAALRALDCGPQEAVMIGDDHPDVAVAQAAGTAFIGAAYGYGAQRLRAWPAPLPLVERFSEVPARLEGLKPTPQACDLTP